jgi:hypothetical protein
MKVLKKVATNILEFVTYILNDPCPKPTVPDFKLLCGDVVTKSKVPLVESEYYEYIYENVYGNWPVRKS